MQPTEARDIADALHGRPVPAVWPRPSHVENEKYLADFWVIEASDVDVAPKPATKGSKACNGKVALRRNAAKAAGRLQPAQVSSDGFGESGSFTTGVADSLERPPGGGVGSGQRSSLPG
jgi:hypothetical protein